MLALRQSPVYRVCELIIPSLHDGARDLGTAPALAARRPPRYVRDVSRQI